MRETLDDPHLPQRPRPVELVTRDVTGQVGQLPEAAGARHGGQTDVVVEVEGGVVDPHRVAQAERHLDQAAAEHRGAGESLGDPLLHPGERVPARDRRRVEGHRHGHVHVEGRRLEVQEAGVEAAEPFHHIPSLRTDHRTVLASLAPPDRVVWRGGLGPPRRQLGLCDPGGQRSAPDSARAAQRDQLQPRLDPERVAAPARRPGDGTGGRPSPPPAGSPAGPAGWGWRSASGPGSDGSASPSMPIGPAGWSPPPWRGPPPKAPPSRISTRFPCGTAGGVW